MIHHFVSQSRSGGEVIRHVGIDVAEGPHIPATITPGRVDQDTINDIRDDKSAIADLDSAIEMMNQVLPTIMVKKLKK